MKTVGWVLNPRYLLRGPERGLRSPGLVWLLAPVFLMIREVASTGAGGVDGPLMGTGLLVGLFVTWVPGVDARSAAVRSVSMR